MTKVLIVDDEEMSVTVISAILEMGGFNDFRIARDGLAGFEMCKTEKPDLVFLDVMLPVMNGYDVCRAIKADPDIAHVRIILLSAIAELSDIQRGIEAGAAAYLRKPFSPRDLLFVLRDTLAAA